MTELLGKIMAQVLTVLALTTKEMQGRRTSVSISFGILHSSNYAVEKFLNRLMGRTEVKDALQRLDVLTGEELRMTVIRVFEVVNHVDRNVAAEIVRDDSNKLNGVEEATHGVNRTIQGAYAGV
jgi:hypothetical protein